ncbi:hypothetical protein V5279_22565 [Bradyrhizobium sp. 26S5]
MNAATVDITGDPRAARLKEIAEGAKAYNAANRRSQGLAVKE